MQHLAGAPDGAEIRRMSARAGRLRRAYVCYRNRCAHVLLVTGWHVDVDERVRAALQSHCRAASCPGERLYADEDVRRAVRPCVPR